MKNNFKFALVYCLASLLMLPNKSLGQTLFPVFDLECYAVYSLEWANRNYDGPFQYVIDEGRKDVPRYRIFAVDPYSLKVVYQPGEDALRTEKAIQPHDAVFEYVGRNYIFGWTEESTVEKVVYTLNTKASIMSVLHVRSENAQLIKLDQLEVFTCKAR